eukprot:scaffold211998_cov28-Tisochrysis_lutea.AAC.1
MVWPTVPALPSCSMPVNISITSAATMLAAWAGRCARERSASLVIVVATTVAKKKSPPTIRLRSFGEASAASLASSAAMTEAYV